LEVLGVLAAAAVALLSLVDINSRYRSAIAEGERSAQGFAEVLAEDARRSFEAVEHSLQVAAAIRASAEAGWYPTAQSAHQALRQLQRSSSLLIALEWTNAAGDVLAGSYDRDPPRANIADRPYFRAQRDNVATEFFISQPVYSKESARWINAVSLSSRKSDGGFAGVIAAELDQSSFAQLYRSIKPGANGSVSVIRRDGQIVMREPFDETAFDRSMGVDDLFTKYLPLADAGAFESNSAADGGDRVAAYQAVADLPLVILVTYARSDVLRPWYEHLRTTGPLVAALIAAMLLGTLFLSRRTRQLARQSALLQATLENMDQGLLVVDEERTIAICNQRAMDLLDLPASLMNSRPRAEDVMAYQSARAEFVNAPHREGGRQRSPAFSVADIYEHIRPNGAVLEIQTVPFGNGSAVRTYKDITKQKRAEQELREGEARYRLLAENATDMVFRLDPDFVREYVSPASREILGYAPEELIGGKPMSMVHPEDVDRVLSAYQSVMGGVDRGGVINRIRHRDGGWIWVEAELRVMRDAATGKPSGILGALRDVSARKAVEAEAIAARLLAEQAAAAQSQFLATMSHELRTPLNSVMGFAGLILDRNDLEPEVRRQLGLIETASTSLLTVVNDILDFSKIEEGKLELAPTAFSLAALIDDSVSIIRGTASRNTLELEATIDREIPARLLGDDARLRQVLLNLLNNAIKFTRQGRVALAVQNRGVCEAGNQLRFVVSDTGIGIAKDKIGRLFERFSQIDGSTSRQFGGTGLGLAICKRLVELMGGQIGVESTPGEGSTFWFEVTLTTAGDAEAPLASPQVGLRPESGAYILLVEDVEVNQEIARSILQTAGHTIDVASDGLDAIAAVQTHAYDLILMDIQMPGMDGVTATKRIRALPGGAGNAPIIAMTANVLPQQVAAFRAAGMNDHVGKPYKREELFAAIDRCLGSGAQRSPPSLATAPIAASPVEQRHIAEPIAETMPIAVENPAEAFQAETFEAIEALLGQEKIGKMLGQLAGQLKERFSNAPLDPSERAPLAREAHKLVSSAGMLGFVGLSRSCAKLEAVLATERDATECFDVVRKACQCAIAEIAARMNRPAAVRTRV
jgi:PAS domain S-box-containing protein